MTRSTTSPQILEELNSTYPVSPEQAHQFRDDGFILLRDVFSSNVLEWYEPKITALTLEHDPEKGVRLEDKDLYGQAFIQVGNLWEKDDLVAEFICCPRLARIACELLGTEGIRMYHDQSLYKEGSGGRTPWHVDQQYWPMASPMSVTAWVPLQPVSTDMGPLAFGRGSHKRHIARDLEISQESDQVISGAVKAQKIKEVCEPYGVGDVSFHYGWTLHRAGPNSTDMPRKVQTVIYMDEDMRLRDPRNDNQRRDRDNFSPGISAGEIMASPKNPVLCSRK